MNSEFSRHKDRRIFLKYAAAFLATSGLSTAAASIANALTPAEKLVTRIANDVMALARSGTRGVTLQRRFLSLFNRYANMNSVARFALGRYRRKLPAKLKSRYYRLVKAYIAGLFAYYINDFRGTGMVIRSARKRGKFVLIDSYIKVRGSRSPVKWRVYSSGGSNRVTDVNFRGIWMSIRLREKFTQILRRSKGDFGALIRFLEKTRSWVPAG